MDSDDEDGGPSGMTRLLKYFESTCKRLDRHSFQSCPSSSLSSDFESAIKFNGVPILPPAMTASRRDGLRQYKKDAVLLEKCKMARKKRHFENLDRAESLHNETRAWVQSTSTLPAYKIPNSGVFDLRHKSVNTTAPPADTHDVSSSSSSVAQAQAELEDAGLQTIDSVNSDFMSLEAEPTPREFTGLALASSKEQKISYDLERLSKALNMPALTSNSYSDISEASDLNPLPEKVSVHGPKSQEDGENVRHEHAESFHTSPYVVTLQAGTIVSVANTSIYEGHIRSGALKHVQNGLNTLHVQNSLNTSTVLEEQCSNKSSPKSLKSGVHFASFVTEYLNTSMSHPSNQLTVIKKISSNSVKTGSEGCEEVMKRSMENSGRTDNCYHYLNHIPACSDNEQCATDVAFNTFEKCETGSSDKENEASFLQQDYKLIENVAGSGQELNKNQSPESSKDRRKQETINMESVYSILTRNPEIKNLKHDNNTENFQNLVLPGQLVEMILNSPVHHSSCSDQNSHSPDTKSAPMASSDKNVQGSISATVSDSQASSRSNTLTSSSQSSGSTVREDVAGDDTSLAAERNANCVAVKVTEDQCTAKNQTNHHTTHRDQGCSPKKLNTNSFICSQGDHSIVTPSRSNICRNSYNLSEPSPALIRAHGLCADSQDIQPALKSQDVNNTSHLHHQVMNDPLQTLHRSQHTPEEDVPNSSSPFKPKTALEMENKGKAEHINRYLSQVQLQKSTSSSSQSWDSPQYLAEQVEAGLGEDSYTSCGRDAGSELCGMNLLRSIAESHGSLEQLTLEELLEFHQRQMNEKRQALIQQQQKDMEELFVQQRREVMLLEAEIKAAQQFDKEQQLFLVEHAPENIKVKSAGRKGEFSPAHTIAGFNASESFSSNYGHQLTISSPSQQWSSHIVSQLSSSVLSNGVSTRLQEHHRRPVITPKQNRPQPHVHNTSSWNQKTPSGSPSDVRQAEFKVSDGACVLRTTSNPDSSGSGGRSNGFISPLANHPSHSAVWSPLKKLPKGRSERINPLHEVSDAEMQMKFDKLTAVAKGFLTRLLMRSDKVQELIKTIRDTKEFAFSFQTEITIKQGMFTPQDKILLERIIAQLKAALLDIHDIFFNFPVTERMALIEQTRLSEQDKRAKAASRDVRESGPKISKATLKFLERKRRSRETDFSSLASFSVSSTSRQKTSPPKSSSPQSTNHIDSRAFRIVHGQSQVSPNQSEQSRFEKVKLDLAKEKQQTQLRRITAASHRANPAVLDNSDPQRKGMLKLKAVANKVTQKPKLIASKANGQPLKSWR